MHVFWAVFFILIVIFSIFFNSDNGSGKNQPFFSVGHTVRKIFVIFFRRSFMQIVHKYFFNISYPLVTNH